MQLRLKSIANDSYHSQAIDGLRGLSVIAVVLYHCSGETLSNFKFPLLKGILSFGGSGVLLFFMLSAFTLIRSFKLHQSQQGSGTLKRFFLRRFFRIMPFWWINVAYWAWREHSSMAVILTNVTLTFGFLMYPPGPSWEPFRIVPFSWSLCAEESFYLLLPLIVAHLRSWRHELVFAFLAVALSASWEGFLTTVLQVSPGDEYFWGMPFARWYAFPIGLLILRLFSNRTFFSEIETLALDQVPFADIIWIASVWAFAVFGSHLVGALAVAMIFIVGLMPTSYLGAFCKNPFLGQFGIAAYSVYLLHWHPLERLRPIKEGLFATLGSARTGETEFLLYSALVLPITAVAAWITYQTIERPGVLLGRAVIAKLEQNRAA